MYAVGTGVVIALGKELTLAAGVSLAFIAASLALYAVVVVDVLLVVRLRSHRRRPRGATARVGPSGHAGIGDTGTIASRIDQTSAGPLSDSEQRDDEAATR